MGVPVQDLEREIDADGGAVVLREELVNVSLDNGRFPGAELADHQDFVQVLPLFPDHGTRRAVRRRLQPKRDSHYSRLENRKRVLLELGIINSRGYFDRLNNVIVDAIAGILSRACNGENGEKYEF